MNMGNFNELITDILEVDDVKMNEELASFEAWDSLTILSIIALADETYNVSLTADEINDSKTVGGLQDMIKNKM